MTRTKLNTPEALIPGNVDYYIKNGQKIRKGTIAAAIANIEILESATTTPIEKDNALNILKDMVPSLFAFGLGKHFVWKNPMIQSIFDNENKKRNKT